jgi:hypothetical protein
MGSGSACMERTGTSRSCPSGPARQVAGWHVVGQPDAVGSLVEGVAGRVYGRGVLRQDDGCLVARAYAQRPRAPPTAQRARAASRDASACSADCASPPGPPRCTGAPPAQSNSAYTPCSWRSPLRYGPCPRARGSGANCARAVLALPGSAARARPPPDAVPGVSVFLCLYRTTTASQLV